jgi:hypothetical protein
LEWGVVIRGVENKEIRGNLFIGLLIDSLWGVCGFLDETNLRYGVSRVKFWGVRVGFEIV